MSIKQHRAQKIPEIEVGMLQMQILWLLNRKKTHGYELMKELNKLKTTNITQGTMYPALQRLQELKLVKSSASGRKINYMLTPAGRKVMRDSCADFCRTFHGIFEDFICEKCK